MVPPTTAAGIATRPPTAIKTTGQKDNTARASNTRLSNKREAKA
jgi:hypothetical protein